MATLNLGNYSDLKTGSVIGYSTTTEQFDVQKKLVGGYSQVGSVTKSGSTWTLSMTDDTQLESFIDTTDRNWSINVEGAHTASVELGSGKDTVTVSNLGSKTDDAVINTGDGNDVVNVTSATAGSVNLGDGADKVVVTGTSTFSVAGGAGKDSVDVSGGFTGTVTLTDFDATEDTLVTGSALNLDSVTFGGDGTLTYGKMNVKVNETNGYYVVNTDKNGVVAWGAASGSNIDLSSYTKPVTIIGNNNDDTADTLIGGAKADTIKAGAGDYAYGGAGNDVVSLMSSSGDGAFVGLATAGGKDSVYGFGSNSDNKVFLFENSITDGVTLSKKGSDITVKQGKGTVELKNVVASGASDETVINIQDNSGDVYDVDFVSGTATVSAADSMHKVYYSDSSKSDNKLNFSSFGDSLVVDLGNTGIYSNTGNTTYYGDFASVVGGTDDTTLMGSASNKETLTAGTGNTTLWGGGSAADVLDGGSSTSNVVTFFYTTGDGKDSVKNGDWGGSDENDVLYFKDVTLASIKNDGNATTFTMADSSDKLTVSGIKADTAVKFTNDGETIQQAKIGLDGKANTWTYDENVNMYLGGKSNTIVVSEDADIWLDGSKGTSYQNVTKVSATSSSGTVVIAGRGDVTEVLEAGKGDTSLWGGAGSSNDTLKGSANGSTTYYFGNGEGSDVITSTGSDDKVMLYNVAASDIASIDTATSGQMKFTLTDGSSLTIKGMNSSSSVSEFELGDGSKWTYNYSNKSWTQH